MDRNQRNTSIKMSYAGPVCSVFSYDNSQLIYQMSSFRQET